MAKHNELGKEGERVAEEFLILKGFIIVEKNFRRPYGEIDIVACETNGNYRFVEVKTVSWETSSYSVSHETNPLENVHPQKIKRLSRIIQVYIESNRVGDWQFDVLAIQLDQKNKKAKVKHLEDIVLEG